MIFENICQIVRKRCQMLKQMRKKALLYEKFLILGRFVQKTWRNGNFLAWFVPIKSLFCWILAKKAYHATPPPPLGIRKNIHPWLKFNLDCVAIKKFTSDRDVWALANLSTDDRICGKCKVDAHHRSFLKVNFWDYCHIFQTVSQINYARIFNLYLIT